MQVLYFVFQSSHNKKEQQTPMSTIASLGLILMTMTMIKV